MKKKKVILIIIGIWVIGAIGMFIEKYNFNDTTETDSVEANSVTDVVSFDDILNKAEESVSISNNATGTEKIYAIIESADSDFPNSIDKSVLSEVLVYLIDEYEAKTFNSHTPVNLYLTRLLDEQLDQYSDMVEADAMVFDMFQICKDIIRMNSENTDETDQSISANEYQIDKVLESVKLNLK